MARDSDVTRFRADIMIGPLDCYLGAGRPLADRVTALLATHRMVRGVGFRGSLWNLSGSERLRTLLLRVRAAATPRA
jgi:hypothetical protein